MQKLLDKDKPREKGKTMTQYKVIIDDTEYDICEDFETAAITFNQATMDMINSEYEGNREAFVKDKWKGEYKIIEMKTVHDFHTQGFVNYKKL